VRRREKEEDKIVTKKVKAPGGQSEGNNINETILVLSVVTCNPLQPRYQMVSCLIDDCVNKEKTQGE